MNRLPVRRRESSSGQRQTWLELKPIRVFQPFLGLFEEDRFLAPHAIASRSADLPGLSFKRKMHLEIRHDLFLAVFRRMRFGSDSLASA